MRNKFLTLLLVPLLAGCSSSKGEASNLDELDALDYSDFADLNLEWKNLFSPAKSQYFVYIYSNLCLHCANIKKEVLGAIKDNKELFYLMEYTSDIPTSFNVSETIGKEKIEEVFIMGTPTLIEITNHYIGLNIAGEKEITDYLNLLPHNICEEESLFQF